jgi:membrane protease YdiL (CAAX protease family)
MLSEKPWKLEPVVMLLFGILVCLTCASALNGFILHARHQDSFDPNSLGGLLLLTLPIHGSVLLVTTLVLWRFRISWREAFGFARRSAAASLIWGALAAILFLPVGMLLQEFSLRILAWFQVNTPVQEAVETLEKAASWDSRTYFILFSVLIAPAAEEIVFRGVLYPAVKRLGFPRLALWGSATLFAAIHLNLPIFLPLLVLGLALALLYEWTDNLLASITAHGVFNGVEILIFVWHQSGTPPLT